MPIEDFLAYTEVDPSNHISVTSSRVTCANVARSEIAHVHKDKGAGWLTNSANFEHLLTIKMEAGTTSTNWAFHYSLSDGVGAFAPLVATNRTLTIRRYHGDGRLLLEDVYGGTWGTLDAYFDPSPDSIRYLKLRFDKDTGTYGTLVCEIYSDLNRTVLLDTISGLVNAAFSLQYVYGYQNYGNGATVFYGYTENVDLQEAVAEIKQYAIINRDVRKIIQWLS
jgi:hypothetical protein